MMGRSHFPGSLSPSPTGIRAAPEVPALKQEGESPSAISSPVQLVSDWCVELTCSDRASQVLQLASLGAVTVRDERADGLPDFRDARDGWLRGLPLAGVRAEECTIPGALLPETLLVKSAPGDAGTAFVRGKDYDFDSDWETIWRLGDGAIAPGQVVWMNYSFTPQRIDSAVLENTGQVVLREGIPHISMPAPPELRPGEMRLANFHLAAPMTRLSEANIYPVMETGFPVEERVGPSPAEDLLPKTMHKLRAGEPLHILAWGDSVTNYNRYQAMFVEWLRSRFPSAQIELHTVAWPGKSSADFLAQPPGSEYNFAERVLTPNPDLIVSEFVNDASLSDPEPEILRRHAGLLDAFQGIGAEWIILAPHYVKPDWMGLSSQRGIDDDPRLYVRVLREFCRNNRVALADASRRYGRLWRQGIPFLTLMENGINHPNPAGHAILADSLVALFPSRGSHQSTETRP